MIELCELSLEGKLDEEGAPVKQMVASEVSKHIELMSLDICKFVKPHFVGQVLELQSKVTYVDQKKGLAYVQVESNSFDLASTGSSDDERNILHLTYRVNKTIRLKQVMPKSYSESLCFLQGKRIIDAL